MARHDIHNPVLLGFFKKDQGTKKGSTKTPARAMVHYTTLAEISTK